MKLQSLFEAQNEHRFDRELNKLFMNLNRIGEYTLEEIYEIIAEEMAQHFEPEAHETDEFNDFMDYAMQKYTKDTGHVPK